MKHMFASAWNIFEKIVTKLIIVRMASWLRALALESDSWYLSLRFVTSYLCDLQQVTFPLCDSDSSFL